MKAWAMVIFWRMIFSCLMSCVCALPIYALLKIGFHLNSATYVEKFFMGYSVLFVASVIRFSLEILFPNKIQSRNVIARSSEQNRQIAIATSPIDSTGVLEEINQRLKAIESSHEKIDRAGFITWKDFITSCLPIVLTLVIYLLAVHK